MTIREPTRAADPAALRDLGERLESLRLLIQSLEEWSAEQKGYTTIPIDIHIALNQAERMSRQALKAKQDGPAAVERELGSLKDHLAYGVLGPIAKTVIHADPETAKALRAILWPWDNGNT